MTRADLTPARLPRGFADRGADELAATREMAEAIRRTYELWGFEGIETPFFEYTDALGKFLPDQDRPNAGVFSLKDDDEQWLSLRYDLTAPLARHVAENFQRLAKPYRSYRFGPVFRNEKPGPGRFRQFLQFDADIVGAPSVSADAEMCMMMADTLEAVGVKRGDDVIKVNNRKILDGVMEAIGLGGDDNAGRRLTVLRAIDKLDRLGPEGVRALLGAGRKDDSGDFTKGAGLDDEASARVLSILRAKAESNLHTARKLFEEFASTEAGQEGARELSAIATLVEQAGYDGRVVIDPSVVRGLEYYTGPVYEVELLLDTKDDKGRPVRFGSVGGGGRYDGLVSRFRGEPVPATGFSIGVSRLQAALTLLGKLDTKPQAGPVVVTVFDRDRVADYQKMVAKLRAENIRAELYLGNPKNMGNQLKYADKRNSPCVIIQGSDEKNDPDGPQIIVKDLLLGAELASLEKDREEYLQKQAEAQRKVPEADLVDEVRRILAKHDVRWN
ncbi:MAG TPA: histidine--tRNA ligase [Hansschlegelia sp.]